MCPISPWRLPSSTRELTDNKKYLSGFSEEFLLSLLLALLFFLEQRVFNLGYIYSVQSYLSAGGDGVSLVHSLEGDSVDLVRSCNEEESNTYACILWAPRGPSLSGASGRESRTRSRLSVSQ